MQVKTEGPPTADVGIIVGRFQVPELTEAHKEVIQHVVDAHDKVIIFLGLPPVFSSSNPMDFETRKRMIAEQFPDVTILYIKDNESDAVWSANLDRQINDQLLPNETALLYGSRDSFLTAYVGKFPRVELVQTRWVSGTEMRESVKNKVSKDQSFRQGVIWSSFKRFPTVYTTVDIAIVDEPNSRLLLGRKAHQERFRFVGGFTDPSDVSFEHSARREAQEETGLDVEISTADYIGSFNIDDWRYRKTPDSIRTLFYWGHYQFGRPQASDDIAEVRWFTIDELKTLEVETEHQQLLAAFLAEWVRRNNK